MPIRTLAGCTVVTADYLPWVRVTAASFIENHPDATFGVFVVDEPQPSQLRDDDRFTILRPADVGLSDSELALMDLIYTPVELCCALKPWLVRRMLDDVEVALYIDADMCVYAPLTELAEQAAGVDLVLSPHSLAPRNDPRMPDDDALLQFGQFNGGFLAVSRKGRQFADWWASKCARECTDWNPEQPRRYLDQRWLDLAIGYFNARVTRDPGINLARWNMYQRDFDLVDGRFMVDGGPLRCFHFSAFNPADPGNIRRDGYVHPKVDPQQTPPLRHLLTDYAQRLIDAGWKPSASREPRRVAGVELTAPVRAAIRGALIDAERVGAVPADVAIDPETLVAWLQNPAEARRVHDQSVMTARAAVGLQAAREHVTLCFGSDLFVDDRLLEAYARHFSANDDATLAIYVPNCDVALASSRMMDVVTRLGLDGPDAPDMIGLPFRATADEQLLAHAVDAVLSLAPPAEAFTGLPWAQYGTLEQIHADVSRRDEAAVIADVRA